MNTKKLLTDVSGAGIRLGLERMTNILVNLNNPQNNYPIIHVAGTNGKGSVCAYLARILTESGYRTGKYTSPHLVDWNERITINEIPISDQDLDFYLSQVKQAKNSQDLPTQFEEVTAVALAYFAAQNIDIAILEVGLGGRLDATNICNQPLVTIITSISLDHTEILGPTLADIAREKAGILKPQTPAVIGKVPPEAQQVIQDKIRELNCPVTWIEPATPHPITPNLAIFKNLEYELPLLGNVQLINSAIAIETCFLLQEKGYDITQKNIKDGIAKTQWLGRIQWTEWLGKKILIDGCHNPENALALRRYLDSQNLNSVNWVIGMMNRKDHYAILKNLLKPQDRLFLVPIQDSGSANPERLAEIALNICPNLLECQTCSNLETGLGTALQHIDKTTVLCGSLYLIGEFMRGRAE